MNLNPLDLKIKEYFAEDDFFKNDHYWLNLPKDPVKCSLHFKTKEMICAGLPYFFATLNALGNQLDYEKFQLEGAFLEKEHTLSFETDFASALSGERIALNLLQKVSSIATYTNKFVQMASHTDIKILDTRKTTPGHRTLEKYGVRIGGGYNHRFAQNDLWMIKDNHKKFFGGIKEALDFFLERQSFYTPIVVEIHDLNELEEAISFNIQHVMLDNFSPEEVKEATKIKPSFMTYEVSGGITLKTLEQYLIEGVDAISVGSLTYGAPPVDISFKYEKK